MSAKYKFIITIFTVLIFFNACEDNNTISEGELIYSITYPQGDKNQPIIALLPKQMSIYFKDNKTVGYISGFWGTFEIRFLNDYDNGKTYTIVRIVNKKYIYQADTGDLPPGYGEMANIKLVNTEKDTLISNLHCKEAIMYAPIYQKPEKIYYTYDIAIDNPNANNPFKAIKGVLVKFKVRLLGIDMIFNLKQIKRYPIDDQKFEIPKDYKPINKQDLENFLKSFTE